MKSGPTHSTEHTAGCNGIDIVYDTFGDHTLPPMVLIMGLGSQMILWEDDFCSQLSDRGFWVIRFDNRDVGRSSKLDHLGIPDFRALFSGSNTDVPYTLVDMAEDTIGLLDALGIYKAHIIGASMGGMIAQVMAIEHPQRLRSLTSIMSSTGDPCLPQPRPEAMQVLYRPYPADRDSFMKIFIDTWTVLGGDHLPMEYERISKLAGISFERGVYPAGNARQLAAIISSGSRKAMLESVKIPTLVIHGDADPLLPSECGIDTSRSIPGSTLKIIPGMGHALPHTIWNDIIDNISKHASIF